MLFRVPVLLCFAAPTLADPLDIVAVDIGASRMSVTLEHPDTGWNHYADGWRIEAEDGTVVGTRELLHPHVGEQPFTRSLTVKDLPVRPLYIRAKCSVDGWSDTRVSLSR